MVTAEAIWSTLEKDASFLRQIPKGKPREVMREIVEHAPTVLADCMEEKATVAAVIRAKMLFLKWTADSGNARKLVLSYPLEAFGGDEDVRQEMAESVGDAVSGALSVLEETLTQLTDCLLDDGYRASLVPAARKEYAAGTLTVGRLLELQPALILKNDS